MFWGQQKIFVKIHLERIRPPPGVQGITAQSQMWTDRQRWKEVIRNRTNRTRNLHLGIWSSLVAMPTAKVRADFCRRRYTKSVTRMNAFNGWQLWRMNGQMEGNLTSSKFSHTAIRGIGWSPINEHQRARSKQEGTNLWRHLWVLPWRRCLKIWAESWESYFGQF